MYFIFGTSYVFFLIQWKLSIMQFFLNIYYFYIVLQLLIKNKKLNPVTRGPGNATDGDQDYILLGISIGTYLL